MAVASENKWIVIPRPNPSARLKLICWPSAGHGPSMFRSWGALLPSDIELGIMLLPGRESRWGEPAQHAMSELAPAATEALVGHLDRPFAFFGHSLGGLIAYCVTRSLTDRHGMAPQRLMVSAHRAPQLRNPHPRIADLPDDQFLMEVDRRHGGIPESVASNHELMALMAPVIRADYQVFEGYVHAEGPTLDCPISAFGGESDRLITRADLEPWAEMTSRSFTLRMMPGGHFFVNDHREAVVSSMLEDLAGGDSGRRS